MMQPVLHKYQIANGVVAFSTTRHGGVSKGNYTSFNINHYCGDNLEHIAENRKRLCALLNIDDTYLVYPHQTHGVEVRRIDNRFMTLPSIERQDALEGVDAIVTDLCGVCIGVSTADCIPVLLYDEPHHAVAAIHAGWRGTVGRIVKKTVAAMCETYGTDPLQLRAVIGPGISLKNFEVGDEVYAAFSDAGFPMDRIAKKYEKWHIDLSECNRIQLITAGVQKENIHMSNICTYDHVDTFFSARRLGINSGRILTAIMLHS